MRFGWLVGREVKEEKEEESKRNGEIKESDSNQRRQNRRDVIQQKRDRIAKMGREVAEMTLVCKSRLELF